MAFYDMLRLEKGMYTASKDFTRILEELDPSMNYKGTPLSGLDACQYQLRRFDIHVGGPGSGPMEEFLQTNDSATLFPEYVPRAARRGMERADLLPGIVVAVTKTNSMNYRVITSDLLPQDKELLPVVEGAEIPRTVVKIQENLMHPHRRGRMLVASCEALCFRKLDLFTVTLRQIGAYIARAQLDDAVNVLLDDDGNGNPVPMVDVTDEFPYQSMVNLWSALQSCELNAILVSTPAIKDILSLKEFQDSVAGLDFQGTGKLATPLGAELLHVPSLSGSRLVGLDKNCALEMVWAGDVLADSDKLIDRQLGRASISVAAGFTRTFAGACRAVGYTGKQKGKRESQRINRQF